MDTIAVLVLMLLLGIPATVGMLIIIALILIYHTTRNRR